MFLLLFNSYYQSINVTCLTPYHTPFPRWNLGILKEIRYPSERCGIKKLGHRYQPLGNLGKLADSLTGTCIFGIHVKMMVFDLQFLWLMSVRGGELNLSRCQYYKNYSNCISRPHFGTWLVIINTYLPC